jgi:hypothetical protein
MLEYGATLIQQVVDAKLDAAFDDPTKGAVVVVRDV